MFAKKVKGILLSVPVLFMANAALANGDIQKSAIPAPTGNRLPLVSAKTIDTLGSEEASLSKVNLIRSIFEDVSERQDRQICDKGTGRCK